MPSPKGQFFIISTIIVAFTLVGIQFLFAGYNLADSSKLFAFQEDFLFDSIKHGVNETFYTKSCPILERDLGEMKTQTERALRERRMLLNFSFTDPCAGATDTTKQSTDFVLNLTTFNYRLYDEFTLTP